MKKILILTAAFGDGHNTAARNIRDALEHMCDDVKVEVLDLFEASYGAFNTLAKKTYLGMVQFMSTDADPGVLLPADYSFISDDAGTHNFAGGATLFEMTEHVDYPGYGIFGLWCGDVLGDGSTALAFETYSGGAHCCSRPLRSARDGRRLHLLDWRGLGRRRRSIEQLPDLLKLSLL